MTIKQIGKVVILPLNRLILRFKKEYTWENFIIRRKYRAAFRALKDMHKGERCFIIGNGPSLTASDLSSIKDEYSFAANRIFYIFDQTEWRPTYYCSQDELVIDSILDKLPSILKECKKMFLISACFEKVTASLRSDENVLFFCAKYARAYKKRLFSEAIDQYISGGGTITYAAIQIAAYMGFREIYLIGVDHSYSTPSLNKANELNGEDVQNCYFKGTPSNVKLNKPDTDNSTISFIKAKEYCDAHSIKIYNATRGGKLEVFPRKQLEDILNTK